MNANVDLYLQHFVQPPIERMSRSFRQILAIPYLLLPLTVAGVFPSPFPKLPETVEAQSD
jgi:hypothetical protein